MAEQQMLSTFFAKRFNESFERSQTSTDVLAIYILKDKNPLGGSLYFPELTPGSVFYHGHNKWTSSSLIICVQTVKNKPMVINACYVLESVDASLGYIQWIEANGMCVPRKAQSGITKALLKGYIDYMQSNGLSISLFSNGQIPSPFFFRNSVISSVDRSSLESWWRFILEDYPDAYLYSWKPLGVNIGQCTLPFYKGHKKIDAKSVIPIFPDDPISRHLKTFADEAIALDTFCDSLSFRPEYIDGYGTHFWLCPKNSFYISSNTENNNSHIPFKTLDQSNNEVTSTVCSNSIPKPEVLQREDTFHQKKMSLSSWINSAFYKLEFSSRDSSVQSSELLLSEITSFSDIKVVKIPITGINLNDRKAETCFVQKISSNNIPAVKDIQNLVRKRPLLS